MNFKLRFWRDLEDKSSHYKQLTCFDSDYLPETPMRVIALEFV